MAKFSSSKLRSAISKYNSAVSRYNSEARRYNANLRRVVNEHNRRVRQFNTQLHELRRQLRNLQQTTLHRSYLALTNEFREVHLNHETTLIVRTEEWHALTTHQQETLRRDSERSDIELMLVDNEGSEVEVL